MADESRIEIVVESNKANQNLKKLESQFKSTGREADNLDSKTGKVSAGFDSLARSGAGLLAGYFSIQGLRSVQRMSEQYTLMEARVRRLSESNEEAAKTYDDLLSITSRTGADLGDTIGLWQSLTSSLDASNDEVLQFTETLQKLGAIGGSSAEDMSNALRQLNQAMAGGILRAEEYNSINEQMPEVLRAVAKELYGSSKELGKLRQEMLAGELTSDRVFNAILNQTENTNKEFAKMPRTVAQASSALTNNLGVAISNLDKQMGASKNFAKLIDFLAGEVLEFNEAQKTAPLRALQVELTRVDAEIQKINDSTASRLSLEKALNEAQSPQARAAIQKSLDEYSDSQEKFNNLLDDRIFLLSEIDKEQNKLDKKPEATKPSGGVIPTKDTSKADPVQTEKQRIQQEIALQDYRVKYFEDSNAKIESDLLRFQLDTLNTFGASSPEYLDAIANEQEARIQLYLDADEEILDNNKDINEAILQNQQNAQRLSEDLMMNSLGLIKESSEEGSALWYASVIGQRGMMAAQAVMSANLMASQATAAQMPLPGTDPTGALTAKAVAAGEGLRIMGYANAALIAAQGVAEIAGARQAGGSVQGGSTYKANELMGYGGLPEIYSAGGNDYVTIPSGGSGTMTPVRKVDSAMGGVNVTIENYGPPLSVEGTQQLSESDYRIIAREEASSEIAAQSRNRSSSLNRNQDAMFKRQKRL